MTTTRTALLPIDPAVSPAQASRVLPIRANLLPEEITAGRNARRTRMALIAAVIAVVAVLAGWYVYAVQQFDAAQENLDTASRQVQRAQNDKKQYAAVVKIISNRDDVTADLKKVMANDLPWAKYTNVLRTNAAIADVTVDEVAATMLDNAAGAGAAAPAATGGAARTVATVSITGTAPDKVRIAAFPDRLADLDGYADPYLTSAGQQDQTWSYAITATITSDALCGRFTTSCDKAGGN